MHIACVNNNGIKYLQVQESYTTKGDGTLKNRKRIVRNIGPLSRYDDGAPDYVKRLRQSFKDGEPLIGSLAELAGLEGKEAGERKVSITFDLDDEAQCVSNPKNIGYFLLDGLYDALGIYDVLNKYKSQSKIAYDLNGIAKLLIFGRILEADSKLGTFEGRERYLMEVCASDNLIEVYRALDCLLNNAANFIREKFLPLRRSVIRFSSK